MTSFLKDSDERVQSGCSPSRGGAFIALVVESDKQFLRKVSTIIRKAQVLEDAKALCVEIIPVQSLNEAVGMLQKRSFDIILTDINLADASGFLVLEQLVHYGKNAPIIILSNFTNWSVLMQAARAGISDFLVKKTLDAGILMRSIFYAIERKKMESKVKEAESLYRSLVEVLPMGLARVDSDGSLIYVNQVFANMAKSAPQQMLGHGIEDCFQYAIFSKAKTGILEVLRTGKVFEVELPLIDQESSEKYLHFMVTPVRGEQSSIAGAQCVLIDITAQKQIQREMDASNALDMLQSGISHLAHALNNALTPVLLDSLNLKSRLGALLPDAPVRRIEQSVEKARSVLRPFLFSTHGVGPRSECLDFCSILNTVVMHYKNKLPPNVRVACDGTDLACSVSGDASMLSKMLTHVLDNALESMSEGGRISLTLQSKKYDVSDPDLKSLGLSPGEYLMLTVVDQGEGIEMARLQRVFEPFQTTKLKPHAGIGLTESLVIIKGHDGNIQLESEVGVGTKVQIYLPLREHDSGASASSDLLLNSLRSSSSKRKTILLVDDEESILEAVQMLIEHLGHDVIIASNGAEALHLFKQRKEPVDLVITDYEMPFMNGAVLIPALRELSPSLKIILCTGLESKERVDELSKLKVDSILYKPFAPASLREDIEKLL